MSAFEILSLQAADSREAVLSVLAAQRLQREAELSYVPNVGFDAAARAVREAAARTFGSSYRESGSEWESGNRGMQAAIYRTGLGEADRIAAGLPAAMASRIVHSPGQPVSVDGWAVESDSSGDDVRTDDAAAVSVLGTVDGQSAVIDETLEVTAETVTGPDRMTGDVTVSVRVRLSAGSASWGSAAGTATAVDYRAARREAVSAARDAALALRAAGRSGTAVIGSPLPRVSLVKGQPVFPVTGEQFGKLSRYVIRRAYGNAANGSRSAHVRAGLSAVGIPVSGWVTDDAAGEAVRRVIAWSVDGLPEAVSARLETLQDRDSREALILGSAARDGLRRVTEVSRPGKLAAARSRWMGKLSPVAVSGLAILQGDAALERPVIAAARVNGSPSYVCSGSPDVFTEAVLSRDAAGQLRFPDLAAVLFMGTVSDACKLRTGSVSGPARMGFKRAAARQYAELSGLSLSWADDAAAAAADMTYAK